MIHRFLGHIKGKSILLLLVSGIVGFVALSAVSFAQDWFEPKTQPPGVAQDPINKEELIRIKSLDSSGRQFKQGNLRVGSITTTDISDTFEIYGDFGVKDSLRIAASGVCETYSCLFSTEGEKFPTFLVQNSDKFVGIGTNEKSGLLSVFADSGGEALYATSANVTAVKGISSLGNDNTGTGRAIQAFVSGSGSIGVLGKSVGPSNIGVFGVAAAGSGSKAGLFKNGNVLVVAGYIQGKGTGLIRVYNISDNTFYSTTGGRGLGVWAKRDITLGAGSTSGTLLTLLNGETLRSYSILAKIPPDPNYRLYNPADSYFSGLTFALTDGKIQYSKLSATIYNVTLTAHLETGVAIVVSHVNNTSTFAFPIGNEELVLYKPYGAQHYELQAELPGETPPFNWSILSGAGSLCADDSGNPSASCGSTVSGNKIYYKFANSYSPAYDDINHRITVKVSAESGSGTHEKDIVLRIINVVPKDMAYFTAEAGSATQLNFEIIPQDADILKFKTGAAPGIVYFPYNAPDNIIEQKVGSVVFSLNGAASKDEAELPVYHVPAITITTTFPDEPSIGWDNAPIQAGNTTDTVALNKKLTVSTLLDGMQGSNAGTPEVTFQCAGQTLFPPYTPTPWIATTECTWTDPNALGSNPLVAIWDPVGQTYPDGISVTKTKNIIVGKIDKNVPSDITLPVTLRFYLNGYSGTQYLSTQQPLNDPSFQEFAPLQPPVNQHIGWNAYALFVDYPANTIPIDQCVAISTAGTNETDVVLSEQVCGNLPDLQYTIRAVNPHDLRDFVEATVDYSVPCGCNCVDCSKPSNEGNACCNIAGGDN